MNSSRQHLSSGRPRGSALLTVLIFTFAMAMLVASILGWSIAERRLTKRTVYWLEARNAAEALCEYGASQIIYINTIYDQPPTLNPYGGTTTGNQPLTLPVIPGSANSFFNPNSANGITHQSDIDTNSMASGDSNGLELVGGRKIQIPSTGELYYVDPAVPENANDPFISLQVHRNDYEVLAKATAVPPDGLAPVTAYVKETVSVRGAPLFNYAIFYANSELELFPGANMTVSGPVHVNGDLFINASSGATLTFSGTVTTSGNIYHSMMNSTDQQTGMDNDNIYFLGQNGSGNPAPVNMYKDSVWHDSTMGADAGLTGLASLAPLITPAVNTNFKNYAQATWPSNVMTQAMGVPTFNPVAFSQAIDTNPATGTGDEPDSLAAETNDTDQHIVIPATATAAATTAAGNVAYLNDPPDSSLNSSSADYITKRALEGIKYSTLAGLYVLVNVTPGTGGNPDTATITYYGPGNSDNIGSVGFGPNGGVKLGTAYVDNAASGQEPPRLVSFVPYVKSGTKVRQGLYDKRQSASVDLVQISMADLNTALQDVNTGTTTGAVINNNIGSTAIWGAGVTTGDLVSLHPNVSDPTAGWNGTVYVDVEAPAGNQVSVGLGNGQTASQTASMIPNTTPSTVGFATNIVGNNYLLDKGLSIATNAPVYIEGNFNADGNLTTGSPNLPDDETAYPFPVSTAEVPVAVIGDAVTLLSSNYFGPNALFPTGDSGAHMANSSSAGNAYVSYSATAPNSTGSTEIASAFIAGNVATNQTASSGGAHNLLRFLENWDGDISEIRGSLVNMYQSKIATGPYVAGGAYYEPPNRQWGYEYLFKSGIFPPNTPEVYSTIRLYFNDLSAAGYTSLRTDSIWGWPADASQFPPIQ